MARPAGVRRLEREARPGPARRRRQEGSGSGGPRPCVAVQTSGELDPPPTHTPVPLPCRGWTVRLLQPPLGPPLGTTRVALCVTSLPSPLGNSGALRRGAIPPPGNLRSPRPAAPHLSPRFCGAAEPVPGLRAPPPLPVPPRAPPAASVPAAKGALGRGTQCGCCWHRGSVCRPRSAACQQHPREHPLFPEALRPPGSRALRCAALRAPAAASRSPALRVRVTSSSVAPAGPVQSQGWKVCLDAPRTPERGLRPGLRP